MSSTATARRLESLFEQLAELTGQRNAIDGRIVDIIAEIDRDGLWGATGARSVSALVAWKTGTSHGNAAAIASVAHRLESFPRCAQGLREGRLSLDQVGMIASRAGEGSDSHYAQLAEVATVSQLCTAIKMEPRPDPAPRPDPQPAITKTSDGAFDFWRITLPCVESATFEAALRSHRDALTVEWRHDRDGGGGAAPAEDESKWQPPMPTTIDAFMRLVETGWDGEVQRRPHGQRTNVVVHLDVQQKIGALHLGPLLPESERQYLTCDTTCEVWFKRNGEVIGSGRTTRTISHRLRRALEHRDRTCVVPGCGATRGLHAHHIQHWEDGGATELNNLVLLCPYHHRLHHRGVITITGPAGRLVVTDIDGQELRRGSLARPTGDPPSPVAPCHGPTGGRADWWWYEPFRPQAPPTTN